jgi:hypothetical protein
MRFAVRIAGLKGLKVYGDDAQQPIRFIEVHTRRQVLHASGHKKDNSPALVSIQANWPTWSLLPIGDKPAFTITIHNSNNNQDPADGDEASSTDLTIPMEHTCCRPVTYRFSLPAISTTTDNNSSTASTPDPGPDDANPDPSPEEAEAEAEEIFEWRRAPACHETRGIRKKTLPALETGDRRPPETALHTLLAQPGAVLVRLTGARWPPQTATRPTTSSSTTTSTTTTTSMTATATDAATETAARRPLGFTKQGEEIVASWTEARDCLPRYYFQFWGAGAAGALGETFTHVAVLTGAATYLDAIAERARRRGGRGGGGCGNDGAGDGGGGEQHGLRPALLGFPALAGSGWSSHGRVVHVVQHGSHPPGHLAVLCGMP